MKKILLPLFFFFTLSGYSQHETDNWYFGNNSGITFSTVPPTFLPGSQMATYEGCTSISDANGNLLFYSNGVDVWARDHTVMPNGTALGGGLSSTQSALCVQHPGNDSLYYIFTPPELMGPTAVFCYSIIDMTLNNGYGDVTNKNTLLFSSSTEKVTAVRHANGTDVWVIGHSFGNADFYCYLITSTGINPAPVISTAGTIHPATGDGKIGVMKASPCGDKIALVVFSTFTELFDFDNSTGIVSNAIQLGNYAPGNSWGFYGTEFSPDGSKLYVTQENPATLVQYDLLAGSPAAIIASADSIVYWPTSYFGTLQMGPDKKIYIARFSTPAFFLACINQPDSAGTACNFTDTAITLNNAVHHGLPNFVTSDFCNLNTGMPDMNLPDNNSFIYPNPTHDFITIHYSLSSSIKTTFSLFNLFGQKLKSISDEKQSAGAHEIKMDMRDLKQGVYFVKVSIGGKEEVRKVVKY